jgi:hypothetical protein
MADQTYGKGREDRSGSKSNRNCEIINLGYRIGQRLRLVMLHYLEVPGKHRVRTDCCVKFRIGLERLKNSTNVRIAGDINKFRKEIGCAFALGEHSLWL